MNGDIFLAKMRFVDIQWEICIRPGANIDETLKSELLQEKVYVTVITLQKQNPSASISGNPFRIKQEPTMSDQPRNNVQNQTNRAS